MDWGHRLVCKVLEEKDLKSPRKLGIQPQHLLGDSAEWYEHLIRFAERNNDTIPSSGNLERVFPDFSMVEDVHEPWEELKEEIDQARRYSIIQTAVGEIGRLAMDGKMTDAEEIFQSTAVNLAMTHDADNSMDLMLSAADFEAEYRERQKQGEVTGIPSGMPWLDRYTLGTQPADFWAVCGERGAGKSFLLFKMAAACWQSGRVPLLVSCEMHPLAIRRRLYGMMTEHSPRDLRRGTLSAFDEAGFFIKLQEFAENGRPFPLVTLKGMASQDANVTWIRGLIDRYEPDCVFVDGMYRLWAPGKEHHRYVNLAREIKNMANATEVPIVGTHQMVNLSRGTMSPKSKKRFGGDIDDVAMSNAFTQEPDVVVLFHRSNDDKTAGTATIRCGKLRDDEEFPMHIITWAIDDGDMGDVIRLESDVDTSDDDGDDSHTSATSDGGKWKASY